MVDLLNGVSDDDTVSVASSSSSIFTVEDASTTATDSTTDPLRNDTTTGSSESSFELARAETKAAVKRSKWIVLTVIVVAAAIVGFLTHWYVSHAEELIFESSFHDYAVEVSELVHFEAYNIFASIDEFSTTITSYELDHAKRSNGEESWWPNVTLPHFEMRGMKNNGLTKALQITFCPLVTVETQAGWEAYATDHQGWLAESLATQNVFGSTEQAHIFSYTTTSSTTSQEHRMVLEQADGSKLRLQDAMFPSIPSVMWRHNDTTTTSGAHIPETTNGGVDFGPGDFAPVWQQAPAPKDSSIINYNLLSHPVFERLYHGMWETRLPVLSEVTDLHFLYGGAVQDDVEHPHSFLLSPVYPTFLPFDQREKDDLSGFLVAVLSWDSYFVNLLPKNVLGMDIVLQDTCGDHFTYRIDGPNATFLGEGDLHDPTYTYLEVDTDFAPFLHHNFSDTHEHCEYDLRIFPSASLHAKFQTSMPIIATAVVLTVFLATALAFFLYDYMVERRQFNVWATARRTNALLTGLFPTKEIRDQILEEVHVKAQMDVDERRRVSYFKPGNKAKLKTFLKDAEMGGAEDAMDSKPIAELFPGVTVMFADIVGFTAWSSMREPSQVFTLLETLFQAFDRIAQRRKAFKVETVGDCYVAVSGLPDPCKDHALVMARFARDILTAMDSLTKKLEVKLGPDTGMLAVRIGLHSGQVIAGVLRGEKSRFQLFGDTMNTAARIESTGQESRIHVSNETASLLRLQGKGYWLKERKDSIDAKGKGQLKTFWIDPQSKQTRSTSNSSCHDLSSTHLHGSGNYEGDDLGDLVAVDALDDKLQRLVAWNVDNLAECLKRIAVRREAMGDHAAIDSKSVQAFEAEFDEELRKPGTTVLDEVREIITLPRFDTHIAKSFENIESVQLGENVMDQLQDFVATIASMYRDNSFHNFEHASHVTMSVTKLLARIVQPDHSIAEEIDGNQTESGDVLDMDDQIAADLHDHTYGITSDPLTQFACIISALIHDVDHTGVPNTQLIKEEAPTVAVYRGKSIAEQNSVDLAWGLLMRPEYAALRGAIYSDAVELARFRQLVVNSVMATDIMDKGANNFRKARWAKAFSEVAEQATGPREEFARSTSMDPINRKATIVIEHLIQASDVAHTMQHWHVYIRWNERLFDELYKNYKDGRAEKNPADFWYKGEIGFFDFYVIPLAKKLQTCGVFGVSSDEYLNYALNNRREWELRGEERVGEMMEKHLKTDLTSGVVIIEEED